MALDGFEGLRRHKVDFSYRLFADFDFSDSPLK